MFCLIGFTTVARGGMCQSHNECWSVKTKATLATQPPLLLHLTTPRNVAQLKGESIPTSSNHRSVHKLLFLSVLMKRSPNRAPVGIRWFLTEKDTQANEDNKDVKKTESTSGPTLPLDPETARSGCSGQLGLKHC